MDSLGVVPQNSSGTQAPLSPRSMAQVIESFKQGQSIDQTTAVTVFTYFKEHPVIQDGGEQISNISLEQVTRLYESLPEQFPDGRHKLAEMVGLISQIIKGTTGIDFDQWYKCSPQNEFVDYLVEIITQGIDRHYPVPEKLRAQWAYFVFKKHMEANDIPSALSLLNDTNNAITSCEIKGPLIFLYAMLQQKYAVKPETTTTNSQESS